MKATGRAHPVGDGANAHPWVDSLRRWCDQADDLVIMFADEPPVHVQRLMETLGVRWRVDTATPPACPCGRRKWPDLSKPETRT